MNPARTFHVFIRLSETSDAIGCGCATNTNPTMRRNNLLFIAVLECVVLQPRVLAYTPFAATQPSTETTLSSTVLNGMATPNGLETSAWFEWGTSSSYGQQSAPIQVGSGSAVMRVSTAISNLLSRHIYHARLVVSNSAGLARGIDQPFITGGKIASWDPCRGW